MPGVYKSVRSHNHVQDTASAVWTIAHNMGTVVVADVFVTEDGKFQKILPAQVTQLDLNTVEIVFSQPRIGTAQLVA